LALGLAIVGAITSASKRPRSSSASASARAAQQKHR